MLLSGLHTVCDIFCKGCFNLVGWKYVKINIFFLFYNNFFKKEHAHEETQKYKEGKFILEKQQIKKHYWNI